VGRLADRGKKLVKQAANLADLDPRSRHKIRIKAKKLSSGEASHAAGSQGET
jgi:hypothetical protein